jgi:hypothetical protein
MTSLETAEYRPRRGGMMTACGQSPRARPIGMADRTP